MNEKLADVGEILKVGVKDLAVYLANWPRAALAALAELKTNWEQLKQEENLWQQLKADIKQRTQVSHPLDIFLFRFLASQARFFEPASTKNGNFGREALQKIGLVSGLILTLTPGLHPTIGLGIFSTSVWDMLRNGIMQDKNSRPLTETGGVFTSH